MAAIRESLQRLQIHEDLTLRAQNTFVLVVLHLGTVHVVGMIFGAVVEKYLGVVERILAVAQTTFNLRTHGVELLALHGLRPGHAIRVVRQRHAGARENLPVCLERPVAPVADIDDEHNDQKQSSRNQYPSKSLYRQPHVSPDLIFSLRGKSPTGCDCHNMRRANR